MAALSDVERADAYRKRWVALKSERATWEGHWRELHEYVRPRSARFEGATPNNGEKKHSKIINSTPGFALRTLAAGMMAGITSPSRPFFRLTTPDAALAEVDSVKTWLRAVEERIREAFGRSNIYNALHSVYFDLALPGTACLYLEEDAERAFRAYVFPCGSYALATSERQQVDTVYRSLTLTVRQLVRKFGREACSLSVRQSYEAREWEKRFEVLHIIEPNEQPAPGVAGPKGMAWRSCWLQLSSDEPGKFLREGGYEEFPVFAPRWAVTGEDVYGHSPGMEALGDIKALQHLEKQKAKLVDKSVDPPMRGPSSLQHKKTSLVPGDVTYVDAVTAGQTFEPAMTVEPAALVAVSQEIQRHEERIKTQFYADLWLMLSQAEGTMTAREVSERREEKLLQLGTVMERLQDELLDPLVRRAFAILWRRGELPVPPEELQGLELKVEYLSIMAQAQKLLGTTAVERLVSFVASVAPVKPEVLDKLDLDQTVDEYAVMLGTPPTVVRPDDVVEQVRAARAKAAAQQQAMAQAQQAADVGKTLAGASTEDGNALAEMLRAAGAR